MRLFYLPAHTDENMQDFRKLRVWHLSQELADDIGEVTRSFPSRQANLVDQMCNAADSVTSNIAESCGRASQKEKAQFFHIALGSANEVDNDLVRAHRTHLITESAYTPLREKVFDVRKMLVSLIKRVRTVN